MPVLSEVGDNVKNNVYTINVSCRVEPCDFS